MHCEQLIKLIQLSSKYLTVGTVHFQSAERAVSSQLRQLSHYLVILQKHSLSFYVLWGSACFVILPPQKACDKRRLCCLCL